MILRTYFDNFMAWNKSLSLSLLTIEICSGPNNCIISYDKVCPKNFSIASKHLKGQLGPPVSDEKCVFGTKNDHFLMLCQEQASYYNFVNMFQELLTRNNVVDVKQISNNSEMESAKT